MAERKLDHVYLGNVAGPTNTYCPRCGALLIKRLGYHVVREKYEQGKCVSCGAKVPIVG